MIVFDYIGLGLKRDLLREGYMVSKTMRFRLSKKFRTNVYVITGRAIVYTPRLAMDLVGQVEQYFKGLRGMLEEMLAAGIRPRLVFARGHPGIPLPGWLVDFCQAAGIEIEFIDIEQNEYRNLFMFRETSELTRLIEQLKLEGVLDDERDDEDRNP